MQKNIVLVVGLVGLAVVAASWGGALRSDDVLAQENTQVPLALDEAASARPWARYRGWPSRDSAAFNTLRENKSPPAPQEGELRPLPAGVSGDPEEGKKLVADRSRGGSCLACHVMGQAGNADLPGNVGPDLSMIGASGRDDEYLFNYIYDARLFNPETVMPPWGTHGIFKEEEILHIVAFLQTLKEPAKFPTEFDDPAKRLVPVEDRDNLDPFVNPGMWLVERAEELWNEQGPSSQSCAACHSDPQAFDTWAASMPRFEQQLDKVIGVEEFIFRHAKATTGSEWLMQTEENTAMAVYLRHLANGQPIVPQTEGEAAKAALARGEELYGRKIGQLNFSCQDCHTPEKGGLKWIRGQWLGETKGQLPHFPTWRTSRQEVWDIRKRLQWCNVAIWGNELEPEAKEYGDLELFLASRNEGLKLNVPGIRP